MEELRDVNNLNYKTPISPDVVAQASLNTYNFNPNIYEQAKENDIMQVDFQEGDDFIDPANSYIRLKVKFNIANASIYSFGKVAPTGLGISGYYESNTGESVLNLIKHVELVTKTGECLFKENFKNEMGTLRNYKINLARKQTLSFMGGYSSTRGFPFFGTTKETTFYIGLTDISPFFNSQLIPYKLLSGAVLRLTLSDPLKSIFGYTIAENLVSLPVERLSSTNMTISNMALILSEKQLYPEVKQAINKQINSPDGLQYSYYTNHTLEYDFPKLLDPLASVITDYTIPVNLSVGKIKYIALKPTPGDGIKANLCYPSALWSDLKSGGAGSDPNATQNLPFQIKIRLGNNVLSTYDVETIPEMYEQTSKALANISFPDCHDVDIKRDINKKSTGVVGFNDYYQYFINVDSSVTTKDTGGVVFAFDFERTKTLGLSGVSTNMERLLEIDLLNYRSINSHKWFISIMYLSEANLFSDGSIAVNK
jgi:hypothetical protein